MGSELTINSNLASMQAQRRLGQNSSNLNQVFERLSSGQRINRASDDAAGLAVSDHLRADQRVLKQGVRNLNDGTSLLNVGEGALTELTNIATRIRELAEQAANGTFGYWQRRSLDLEAQKLSDEYTRIAQSAEFNGSKIFDGSFSDLRLQTAYGSNGAVIASIGGVKGSGTFAEWTSFADTANTTSAVAFGDVNGDGKGDVVSAGGVAGTSAVLVRLGNGDGNFAAPVSYAVQSTDPETIALGDLTGDGALDIVSAGLGGTVTIRIGTGDGSFGAARSYAMESTSSAGVSLGDLNADGILDLVTAGWSGGAGRLTVRLGTGNGTFGAALSYATETVASNAVALSDLNGDGLVDVVTAGVGVGGGIATVRLGRGDGTLGAAVSYTMEGSASRAVALSDINNDGIIDLLTSGSGGAGASVRFGVGDGTFGSRTSYATESFGSFGLAVADFNGDGTDDLITSGASLSPAWTVRIGSGGGTFGAAVSYQADLSSANGLVVGDLNGDGILDMIGAGYGGGAGRVSVRLGTASNGVGALVPFSLQYRDMALQSMGEISRTINRISAHRGHIGAFQSRIGSAVQNAWNTIENYAAAESQIRDSDVAFETANLAKEQILQQAAASVLAQANRSPEIALLLLS